MRSAIRIQGKFARGPGQAPRREKDGAGYLPIHPIQVDLLASIQAATTSSTDLPFKSTSATIAPMSALDRVKASMALAARITTTSSSSA